uniref:FBD domain-containing protein n=1 Tax=Oryza glumipatula TaxID=40148 RepID=A0A0E0BH16_9ORYZ
MPLLLDAVVDVRAMCGDFCSRSDWFRVYFRRDLKWCPTFRNVKTSILNEYWCVPADFIALACILEHSPILEKLVLQLFSMGPKHKVEMNGNRYPSDVSAAVLEHLKTVEVKCEVVDERVHLTYVR